MELVRLGSGDAGLAAARAQGEAKIAVAGEVEGAIVVMQGEQGAKAAIGAVGAVGGKAHGLAFFAGIEAEEVVEDVVDAPRAGPWRGVFGEEVEPGGVGLV